MFKLKKHRFGCKQASVILICINFVHVLRISHVNIWLKTVIISSSVIVTLEHVCTSCHQVLSCSATHMMSDERKVKEHPQFPNLERLQENQGIYTSSREFYAGNTHVFQSLYII